MEKTEAVILQKQPLGEADELVMCFTKEQGKMLFRARGVRKSRAKHTGALLQCNRIDVYFVEGRRGPIITDTVLQESFPDIRTSEQKLVAARSVCESLARIIPSSFVDLVLWSQLSEYLQVLSRFKGESNYIEAAPAFFMFLFLRLHGTGIGVHKCAVCSHDIEKTFPQDREDSLYLSPEHGGVVHSLCLEEHDQNLILLSPVARATLRTWASLSFEQVLGQELSEDTRKEVISAVKCFSDWHLGERAIANNT